MENRSCPRGPPVRGSSTVFDVCRQSLHDHNKAVFSLHDSLSPCLDAKIPIADVSPSVRVGALGAESVQYSYVAMHRLVLYPTMCRPHGSASRLPNEWQSFFFNPFNLFES